ncbi:MAG: two-component system chemotaxis response regulator CheB [Alteromonadaceae bacterium]|jgi:two-component system chemotaxis response regulator CheB
MNKIKVLIIDDSSVIRGIVREVLSGEQDIEVVGEAKDPLVAREQIKKLNPDVLTLDVEMPKMDGITFLNNLMRLRPMPVVMLSTLTTKGADITLEALELGAVDFIAKPSFEELLASKNNFKAVLVEKVRSAAGVDQKNYKLNTTVVAESDKRVLSFTGCKRTNHLVAIGASTGGTEAIKKIITTLPSNSPPVVITLHIPETFSARFAERMNENSAVNVQEARHGQKIKEGNVYVAPGNKHLKVESKGGGLFCTLEDSEPVNRHKPAVDVLFESLIPIAANVQAVLLTGMGSDGAKGLLNLKNNGAMTIIQDKQTSLIWGMPGSAFALNAHIKQKPLTQIAKEILKYAAFDRNEMKKERDV